MITCWDFVFGDIFCPLLRGNLGYRCFCALIIIVINNKVRENFVGALLMMLASGTTALDTIYHMALFLFAFPHLCIPVPDCIKKNSVALPRDCRLINKCGCRSP